MKEETFFKKSYRKHIKQIKNLSVSHEKIMICFSGIAGSGKTYIAEKLEKKYKSVRINSNDIRDIIMNLDKNNDIDKNTYDYLDWFFKNYKFNNKLIMLDQGIDRRYEYFFSVFRKKNFKIFIIRLKVSRKKSEERIIKKLGKLDENYINNIDRWIREWKEVGKNVKPDIIIENEKDDKLNLKSLYKKLDKMIK